MKTSTADLERPKARQILAGARETFLAEGFEGASVDAIARRAGVSKATLYSYFPDKRALFAAVVDEACQAQADRLFRVEADGTDIESTLLGIARSMVAFVTSPFAQAMFRVAVAESARFPELGRTFYESGPQLGAARLAQLLSMAHARGQLCVDDAELAAHQFAELCRAELFYKVLFGIRPAPGEAEIERIARAAVATFMARHAAGRRTKPR